MLLLIYYCIFFIIYLIKKYLIDAENSDLHHINKLFFKVY